MQHSANFNGCKNDNFQMKFFQFFLFFVVAQNMDFVYKLEPLIELTSTHNLCLRAKKKEKEKENNVYPCKPRFHHIKVGCNGGINPTDMFS